MLAEGYSSSLKGRPGRPKNPAGTGFREIVAAPQQSRRSTAPRAPATCARGFQVPI